MNWQFPEKPKIQSLKVEEKEKEKKSFIANFAFFFFPSLIVASGLVLGIWQPLEQLAYRGLFRLRGTMPWDERVVLIDIDEASLKELGRFPWPRKQYTQLLNQLSAAEPSVVVLDVLMPESSPEDAQMAAAMEKVGQVVLAQGWDRTTTPLRPTPELSKSAIAIGHIANHKDSDGLTRQVVPQLEGVPLLSIAASQVYSLVKEPVKLPPMNQPLLVNWPGEVLQAPHYSFVSVLQGKVPASAFKGKIVMVGVTAAALDPLNTPFDGHPPASGIHLHATVLNNLLQQNCLKAPDPKWILVFLLLGGPILGFTLNRYRARHQLIAVVSLCSGWVIVSVVLLRVGYLMPVVSPVGLFCLTAASLSIQERLRMKAQLQHIEQQQQQRQLYDSLTGLPNRTLFMERLEVALERTYQFENYLFAVLFVDLDRFKVINDSLGHTVGDKLLVAIAHRLCTLMRPRDTVARLGGDEFTILLEEIQQLGDATRVAESIHEALASPFYLDGHEVFAAASIGIALSRRVGEPETRRVGQDGKTIPFLTPSSLPSPNTQKGQEPGLNPEWDLLRDADIALSQAKIMGKGRYAVFHTTLHARAIALLQLETDLRLAIGALSKEGFEFSVLSSPLQDENSKLQTPNLKLLPKSEFRVYYQPIVSLSTGKITAFEALVRWQHPKRGLVSPLEFIPVAEETGLMAQLDWWVLREACCQMRAWQERFVQNSEPSTSNYEQLTIGVNLSAMQFAQSDMVQQIDRIVRETGLETRSLKLEITETCLLEDADAVTAMLEQLRALGVKVGIDDFGTGYSSLGRLHCLPIDTLKIDRSFISGMGEEENRWEIVQTIMTLAHNLGMDVVAEGIETAEQMLQLKRLQCEYGQGYFFSKPVDAPAAEELLAAQPQW
ncbi:EAL domain-containing protein [Coleofasciculus sp. FACHB-129]|uniref:EAL domain-containing protein n=1 Tax=Cyanophyceae TaxID=3028117 RepID=UPI0016896118|nr:EAL domain-containing protein [Coleofasciculus sp. FACHB-129]MBD1896630.1 EAL domain-containing protein [Coleofasciculus sp. FACHB-129]